MHGGNVANRQIKAASKRLRGDHRKLRIVYRSIEQLKADPSNPRIHSERQVRQIAKSIETFGITVPVLVDKDLQIIAGHGRIEACKLLGIDEVPTIALAHLSPSQAKAFLIADNRLTEIATWDARLLGEQLKILSAENLDFDLEVIGFETAEIDLYIEGLSVDNGEADPADEIPEVGDRPKVSALGDLWALEKNRVVCGNALDPQIYSALMADRKASAIFTDPPYNVKIDGHATGLGKTRHREFIQGSGEMSEEEFTDFLSRALRNAASNSIDGSIHFVCMDWRHIGELLTAGRRVYDELKNLCVWNKGSGGMGSFYRSQHELVCVFRFGKAAHRNNFQLGQYGRYRTNVWNYPGANSLSRGGEEGNLSALHPTVKPVGLVADAIMDVTQRGDIVLDPFLGSGTTVIAAEKNGRTCFGMELDPIYVDTIVRRWQKFTGKFAVHATSGRKFNEIEEDKANG